MNVLIAVGSGGCLGALLRFGVILWAPRLPLSESVQLPLGVILANLGGCFLLGLLKGAVDAGGIFSDATRLFLFTGLLGGFTTFSTFGAETVDLLERGQPFAAMLYVGISVFGGILLVWAGLGLAGELFPGR